MKKWWIILVVLVLIQFIRPSRNLSGNTDNSIKNGYVVPVEVQSIINRACNDCHSNTTVYPWYTNVQPLGWWLANHVKEGKNALNFDEFMTYQKEDIGHIFDEIAETVEEKEMPLGSYTWFGLHPEAKLTDAERATIVNWAKSLEQSSEKE